MDKKLLWLLGKLIVFYVEFLTIIASKSVYSVWDEACVAGSLSFNEMEGLSF